MSTKAKSPAAHARKKESAALLELTAILENASVGVAFTCNRIIQRCNRRAAEILGFDTVGALVGKPANVLYPDAESYERIGREASPTLGAGESFTADWEFRKADGSPVWCRIFGKAVDWQDADLGTVWVIEDITETRRTEESLRYSVRKMGAIMENAPVGIFFTRDRLLIEYNPKCAAMMGIEGNSGIGVPARAFFRSDEEYTTLGRSAGPLLAQGKPFQSEVYLRRLDTGADVWVSIVAYVQNAKNPTEATIWMIEDRTAVKAAEDALHHTVRELEALMDNASVAILFTRDRRVVRANSRFAEMFRYGRDEMAGLPGRALYPSDEVYANIGRIAGALLSQAKPFQMELFLRRKDGTDFWANLFAYVQNRDKPGEGTIWIAEDRSEIRRTEEALQRSHAEQQLILDHSVVGIAFIKERVFQRCNQRLEEIYGCGPGELDGQPTRVTFPSDEIYEREGAGIYAGLARGESFATELIQKRFNGEPFWVRITGRAVDSAAPQDGSIWNFEDISARKIAEESLRESETLQRAILESASLLILSTDRSGRILSCNPAAERMLGMPAAELLGQLPAELFFDPEELTAHRLQLRADTGLAPDDSMAVLLSRAQLGQIEEGEWTFRRAGGERFPVQLSISPLREGQSQVKGFLLVAADITERKRAEQVLKRSREELEVSVKERTAELEAEVVQRRRAEERLKHLALHDGLTGLPNRSLLRQRLVSALEQIGALGQQGAVLFIDLDRFKNINDSLGHRVGDSLLMEVARRIAAEVRTGDTVARLGGDEFVVVAPTLVQPDDALRLAQKIREGLEPAIRVSGHELFATASVGISLFPRDGGDPDALLANADGAMYQAKAAGRNAVRFFDPAMAAATEQYLQTESSLRRAIAKSEFEPFYQPIVGMDSGKLEGVEMLVRWRHPERGLVMPAQFIAVAEDCGLIGPISSLLLVSACRQLRAWRAAGLPVPTLAINLSAMQFRDRRMIDAIIATVAAEGIAPENIELEITETALMLDGEQTLATLRALADAGFSLSVDDFGTGYSSLSYLKRFPVSKLKIDRSFIQDMTENPDDEAIVNTIITLARTLRLTTIAEGVETVAQRDALRRLGCNFAQGYLFGRPMTVTQLENDFLMAQRPATA